MPDIKRVVNLHTSQIVHGWIDVNDVTGIISIDTLGFTPSWVKMWLAGDDGIKARVHWYSHLADQMIYYLGGGAGYATYDTVLFPTNRGFNLDMDDAIWSGDWDDVDFIAFEVVGSDAVEHDGGIQADGWPTWS